MADSKSFYSLDYIIEINEKRLEQYSEAYQKNYNRFTNLLFIYSILGLFLVQLTQRLIFDNIGCWFDWNHLCFYFYIVVLGFSLFNTIRLLMPISVAYLDEPKIYYRTFRMSYEEEGKTKEEVDNLIKASYINELEEAVSINKGLFTRKGNFYLKALQCGLLACIPYLFCLLFHFGIKTDTIQKVEIVNSNKLNIFDKTFFMAQDKKNNSTAVNPSPAPTTSSLPGIKASDVKPSHPLMVREGLGANNSKK
ncbi:hypothetical protein [Parasediminibacterium sp. JCM 36343]|uniref:hypothetical protein n=1 Tax=Parasediminibacterium sp. JCM 36343 TaxID=3374279 RepID=UPI00397C5F65